MKKWWRNVSFIEQISMNPENLSGCGTLPCGNVWPIERLPSHSIFQYESAVKLTFRDLIAYFQELS